MQRSDLTWETYKLILNFEIMSARSDIFRSRIAMSHFNPILCIRKLPLSYISCKCYFHFIFLQSTKLDNDKMLYYYTIQISRYHILFTSQFYKIYTIDDNDRILTTLQTGSIDTTTFQCLEELTLGNQDRRPAF